MRSNKNAINLIGICGGLVVLSIWTTFQDPFNVVKLGIIYLIAAWLIGHLIFLAKEPIRIPRNRNLLIIVIVFLFSLLISALLTDVKRTAFFGDVQRGNGFLLYLGLSILMLASAFFINYLNIHKLYLYIYFISGVLSFYGLMQSQGKDFVAWNNPYNSVISTLGNPNFAASMMAIFFIVIFSTLFNSKEKTNNKIVSLVIMLLLLITIVLSNARQGILALVLGVGVFLNVLIFNKSKKLGFLATLFSLGVALISVMGMLQRGPLEGLLYKESVSVRGFYWRAGLKMFKDNLWTGVGVDRYGAYFKEYREISYPLRYGFDITSTNAHNVVIQFFSTAGIITGISYLTLLTFIFLSGVKGIKNSNLQNRVIISGFFAAWLAYQAQSIISIDSPALACWGWVMGGIIVGLSSMPRDQISLTSALKDKKNSGKVEIKVAQPLVSFLCLLLTLFIIVFIFRADNLMFKTRLINGAADLPKNSVLLQEYSNKVLSQPLLDPNYRMLIGNYLANNGFADQGISEIEKVLKDDNRCTDCRDLLSTYYSQLGKNDKALKMRLEISKLDPYNAKNLLIIGRIYKALGDFEKMNEVKKTILSFAENTEVGKSAVIELVIK